MCNSGTEMFIFKKFNEVDDARQPETSNALSLTYHILLPTPFLPYFQVVVVSFLPTTFHSFVATIILSLSHLFSRISFDCCELVFILRAIFILSTFKPIFDMLLDNKRSVGIGVQL